MFKQITYILIFLIFSTAYCQIAFEDQAVIRGVGESSGYISLGMGISFNDFNNDGWDDITIVTEGSENIKIFKNTQNGNFVQETVLNPNNTFQQKQPIWIDFDNDGDKDLFVTSNTNGNRLYRNDSSTLIDITAVAGLPIENLGTYGASWGDYNNDGFLDLFISNRDGGETTPNYLFKNNGNETFTEVNEDAGILESNNLSFCAAFFDYNNDGWQDIYVANDRLENPNFLYRNDGDGTFTEVGESAGVNVAIDAMSTTIGDYNNDGWFDIYITNSPEGNVLFKNNGDGTFTDVAVRSGTVFNSFAWGSVFLDAENDGDLDLYVSGSISSNIPNYLSSAFYENQNNGTFTLLNNGSFSNDYLQSYSNAIGDIDNDGYPEIIVSNSDDEDIFLWKNNSNQVNNWLKVKLQGTISNRQGIGSIIEIGVNEEKQFRYTLCGEGYLAQNSDTEFFGLGSSTLIDYVKVTWLSGTIDYIENVQVNEILNIIEGSNTLSINDNRNKINLKIYPNPISKNATLETTSTINCLIIYDTIGSEVFKTCPKSNKFILNLDYFSAGIYFLKIEVNGNEMIKKIVKK